MRRWNGWGRRGRPREPAAGGAAAPRGGDRRGHRRAETRRSRRSSRPSRPRGCRTTRSSRTTPRTASGTPAGQSLPDWIALRCGRLGAVPDGVARPADADEVRELLAFAARTGASVIPYGGGTSVVGGVTPRPGRPAEPHDRPRPPGRASRRSTSGAASRRSAAGRPGPDLEAALAPARPDPRPLPAVVRALDGRWLGRGPVGRPAVARLRPDRGAVRRRPARGAGRLARPAAPSRVGRRPGPPPARPRLGGTARHPDRRHRPGRAAARSRGVPGLVPAGLAARGRGGPSDRAGGPAAVDGPGVDAARDRDAARARRRSRARSASCGATSASARVGPEPSLLLVGASGAGAGRRVPPSARSAASSVARAGSPSADRSGGAGSRRRFRTPDLRDALWEAGLRRSTRSRPRSTGRRTARPRRAVGRALRHGLDDVGRAGPRVQPPVARLPERLEPLRDVRVPPRRRPGRDARALAAAQGRGEPGDRRARRHDQPPARRRPRPRAVPSGREGSARDGGARRRRAAVRPGRDHEPRRPPRGRSRR